MFSSLASEGKLELEKLQSAEQCRVAFFSVFVRRQRAMTHSKIPGVMHGLCIAGQPGGMHHYGRMVTSKFRDLIFLTPATQLSSAQIDHQQSPHVHVTQSGCQKTTSRTDVVRILQ